MSRRVVLAVVIVGLVGAVGVAGAWAEGGTTSASDGGNSVTVGAGSSSSSAATAATHPRPGPGGGPGTGPTCRYISLPAADAATAQGSQPGQWLLIECPGDDLTPFTGELGWFRTTFRPGADTPPAPGSAPPPSTRALALRAEGSLSVPDPVIEMSPSRFSVVNLQTWLWIDADGWRSISATASAGGVSATATAVPQSVVWTMGDGGTVTCVGPGTAYNPSISPDLQSTTCSYIYRTSSAGQPSTDGDPNDGAYPVTASIEWSVTWRATGAPGGGALPPLHTTSTTAVRVEQIESVGSAG